MGATVTVKAKSRKPFDTDKASVRIVHNDGVGAPISASETASDKKHGKEKLGATARSFAILEHVARSRSPVDVLDIIGALKLPKATAYRLVDWFVSQGYLSREPGRKRLLVGSKFANLAFGALSTSMRNAQPHIVLQRLVHNVNETCNIGTVLNGEVVYLDRVEADHWPLRLQFGSGSRVPLHCSAIGKLFLAMTPAPRRKRLLEHIELKPFTDHTITDPIRLDGELRQIRKDKVAFDRQEFLAGVVCMAVPIIGCNGELLSAVALQAPEARLSAETARSYLPALERAADALSDIFQIDD